MTIKGICQIKREIFVRLHLRHCRLSTWNLRHADWVFCIKSLLCKNSDVSNRLCTTLSNNLERNDIFVTGRGEESAASMDHRGTHWEMDIMPYMDINYAQRRQEGWLSPTERASVSAISLRHNLATLGESRRYVVAFTRFAGGGIWLPKAHFGLPWVSPWDNCSKCLMDGKRIQCLSNTPQHVAIYLQAFSSNSTRKFKSSPF